ncbi:hypothetical protein CWO91_31490 [Bradyrhizobium genosp. SA-3]|uniref:hypothetical protein n=1 Tax=Bradyrhizobium genosp. SA-3 TaxID=508868 RepID=UPI001029FA81|nr:hypothetical protein [Bradyrhizobium genosp. SA-3]RZN03821.1 hypothetical protein CWO91_31490 [Bradyrhizobium genosp. SA-3]
MLARLKKPDDPSAWRAPERKANGAKPQGVAPAVFYRIREHGVRLRVDPRLTAEQMDAKLRPACAVAGMLEIAGAETGEVA